jgi:hypothetical protein
MMVLQYYKRNEQYKNSTALLLNPKTSLKLTFCKTFVPLRLCNNLPNFGTLIESVLKDSNTF